MNSIFDPDCRRCSLSDRPRAGGLAVCIPGVGPDDADIMFMGEAPGGREEEENEPFVGPAGRELDRCLERVGLARKDVRISNPVRCRPPDNRRPTKEEVAACMIYTVKELAMVRPKVIVALGGAALKALTGKEKIGENRGRLHSLLPEYRSRVKVLPTYHPASYLNNPGMRDAFQKAILEDFKLARKIARGRALDARIVTPYTSSDDEIRDALRVLAKQPRLACDLEWEVIPQTRDQPKGMWPWSQRHDRLPREICVGIGARVDGELLAVSLPFDHKYSRVIRKLVERVPTDYHHATADLIWEYSMGWRPRLGDDTLLFASVLGFDTSLSLKTLASMHTKMPAAWEQDTNVGVYPATDADWASQTDYNAKDVLAEVMLREFLYREMRRRDRRNVLPLYRRILIPATEVLARTSLEGTPIDEDLLIAMQTEDCKKIVRLTERVGKRLQLPSNSYEKIIDSSDKLGPYLERAGVETERTKKTNRYSITDDFLIRNKDEHPAIKSIRERRKIVKRNSAYWKPWRKLLALQGDGRLHTIYKLFVASTGRTSAESELGNTFQQFLRGEVYRKLVAADEEFCILSTDQSQIELRIIAWLANERRMLEFFRTGGDLHTAIAGFMKALDAGWTIERYIKNMSKWTASVTSDERYGAKPVNFGLGFGGGPGVVQRTARKDYGITFSDEQSQTAYDAYHQFYEDIAPWHESCWRFVEQGWVETPLHRIRELRFSEHEDEEGMLRKAINTPVQSTASDISMFCTVYSWELLRKEYGKHVHRIIQSCNFFHDAMIAHVLRKERKAVGEIVRTAWEHPPLERLRIEMPVPLKADMTIGTYWGDDSLSAA